MGFKIVMSVTRTGGSALGSMGGQTEYTAEEALEVLRRSAAGTEAQDQRTGKHYDERALERLIAGQRK